MRLQEERLRVRRDGMREGREEGRVLDKGLELRERVRRLVKE